MREATMPPLLTRVKEIPRGRLILAGFAVLLLFCCFRATVRGDGVGYYSYLPTIVAHQSFDVGPTFDQFIANNTPVNPIFLQITLPNGLTANFKPVGSALMALPFYVVAHLVLIFVVPGSQSPDVGSEYQLAFTAASLFFVALALILIYRFVRGLWGRDAAVLRMVAMDRVMFEHWLPQSAPNIFFGFLHPHLGDMLFSTRHGWLSWSPIVAIAALGMPAVVRRLQWFGAGLVAIAVGELYVT